MAPLQFGIPLIPFQMTDVAGPLDILSCSSVESLKEMDDVLKLGEDRYNRAINAEYHYIGETMEPVQLSSSFRVLPSVTCEKCPKLDYLLVGGPMPEYFMNIPPVMGNFIKERSEEVKQVFTTCTGGMVVGMLGLLDGKNATANHQVIPLAKQLMPKVNWTAEKQWVVDGKWWTAGGACAGMDMFAYWVKHHYGQELAEVGWALLDFEPRDVKGDLVPLKYGLRVNGA